jgi:hypothetical protein
MRMAARPERPSPSPGIILMAHQDSVLRGQVLSHGRSVHSQQGPVTDSNFPERRLGLVCGQRTGGISRVSAGIVMVCLLW